MTRLLPLFPLPMVAFPGVAIPLHIFEDRYREMVGQAEANGTEFGIVMAKDAGVANSGCTVVVEQVLQRYDDGRFDVLTLGRRRFMLLGLNQDKPYLRGQVDYFDDEDFSPIPSDLRRRAMDAYLRVCDTLRAADQDAPDPDLDPNHPFLGFHLAHATDDHDFQHQMQRARSEADRLTRYIAFADEYARRKIYRAKMRQLAPRNGHGHKPEHI